MKKQSLLLLLAMLFIGQAAFAYDFSAVAPSGQTLYYNIVDGAAQVTSQNESSPYYSDYPIGSLIIPSFVTHGDTTYQVTSIGINAFRNCSDMTSVTIPNTITSIGDNAFNNCNGMTSVNMGNTIRSIGRYAFSNCSNITSITISDSVTFIGENAFNNCYHLSTVNFNAINCMTMGQNSYPVFNGCTALTSINIGNGVLKIPNYSFKGCNQITTITIPFTVKTIGDYAFSYCYNLSSITIPDSVTEIGDYAFSGCGGLSVVHLSNS